MSKVVLICLSRALLGESFKFEAFIRVTELSFPLLGVPMPAYATLNTSRNLSCCNFCVGNG